MVAQDGPSVSPTSSAATPPPATLLPPRPDFAAIEKAARDTAADRQNLMTLIGQLVFSWSNNESLLIYVLMLLLKTPEDPKVLAPGRELGNLPYHPRERRYR